MKARQQVSVCAEKCLVLSSIDQGDRLLVGAIYRSTNSTLENDAQLSKQLVDITSTKKKIQRIYHWGLLKPIQH